MRSTVPVAFTAALSAVLPTALLVTAGADAATHVSARAYPGRAISTRYGPVQVTLHISGRRILYLGATAPTQPKRAAQLNERALVVLSRETLTAQSAKIHVVTGATITSRAFQASVASALRAAHL